MTICSVSSARSSRQRLLGRQSCSINARESTVFAFESLDLGAVWRFARRRAVEQLSRVDRGGVGALATFAHRRRPASVASRAARLGLFDGSSG